MANITIKESRVLNLREFTGTDGRSWKGAELLWQGDGGAAFSPGQFFNGSPQVKEFSLGYAIDHTKEKRRRVLGMSASEQPALGGFCS